VSLKEGIKSAIAMNGVRKGAYADDTLVISIEDVLKIVERVGKEYEDCIKKEAEVKEHAVSAGVVLTINQLTALYADLNLAVNEISGLITGECSFSNHTKNILTEVLNIQKVKFKKVQDVINNTTVGVPL
jgi:hypothetical protein